MSILAGIGRRLFAEPVLVLFDGNCALCRRTIRIARAIDIFDQLVPIDALDEGARREAGAGDLDFDALMQAMHVVIGTRVWAGFEACRVIAGRLPLLWPALPFLYLWPVPALGRRVYRRVADTRTCPPSREPDTTTGPSATGG